MNHDNFDSRFANMKEEEDMEQIKLNNIMLRRPSIQEIFDGYTYKSSGSMPIMASNSKPTTANTL